MPLTESGCDAVPIAKCYDQSYPPMDPTSIGAMPTMERGADGTNSPHDPRTGQFGRGGTTGGGHGPSTRELVEAANRNSPENKKKAAELAEFEKQNAGNTLAPRKTEAGATTRANQTHGPHQPGRNFHDDEPSQPSGMQEPTDAEQTPAEREQLRGELRYGKARHEGKITGQEHKGFIEAVHKNAEDEPPRGEEAALRAGPTGPEVPHNDAAPTKHDPSNGQFTGGGGYAGQEEREKYTSGGGQLKSHAGNAAVREAVREYSNNQSSQKGTKEALRKAGVSEGEISKIDWNKNYFSQRVFGDAAPQPDEPGHEAQELAVVHELEAMHNPASSFEDALFGGGRAHDYSRDATGLPQTVTHRQMQNIGASFNFGEGVTK